MSARRAVAWVATLLGLLGVSQAWRIGTDHLGYDWPVHAKWHALIGGLFLALLSLILLVTVWGPYRAGKPGVEGPLAWLLAGPAVAVLLGIFLLPGGAPGQADAVLAAVAGAVAIVTALLAWRTRV